MELIRVPDINSHIYGQLICDKEPVYYSEEKIVSTNGIGKTGQLHAKE